MYEGVRTTACASALLLCLEQPAAASFSTRQRSESQPQCCLVALLQSASVLCWQALDRSHWCWPWFAMAHLGVRYRNRSHIPAGHQQYLRISSSPCTVSIFVSKLQGRPLLLGPCRLHQGRTARTCGRRIRPRPGLLDMPPPHLSHLEVRLLWPLRRHSGRWVFVLLRPWKKDWLAHPKL